MTNPEATAERIAKLPAWAREHIEHLERTVQQDRSTYLAELAELSGASERSPFYWETSLLDRTVDEDPRMRLPHGRAVLELGKDKYGREHNLRLFRTRTLDGLPSLEVVATQSGLRIFPRVSNSIELTTLHRDIFPEGGAE